jgi:hypothetical protein
MYYSVCQGNKNQEKRKRKEKEKKSYAPSGYQNCIYPVRVGA